MLVTLGGLVEHHAAHLRGGVSGDITDAWPARPALIPAGGGQAHAQADKYGMNPPAEKSPATLQAATQINRSLVLLCKCQFDGQHASPACGAHGDGPPPLQAADTAGLHVCEHHGGHQGMHCLCSKHSKPCWRHQRNRLPEGPGIFILETTLQLLRLDRCGEQLTRRS